MSDEFDGVGGAYVMKDGKRVRVSEPTRDHPEGNRARDKDGKPLEETSPPAGGGVAPGAGVVGEKAAPPAPERPSGPRRLKPVDE